MISNFDSRFVEIPGGGVVKKDSLPILGLQRLASLQRGFCVVQESVCKSWKYEVKIHEILSFNFGKVNKDFEITMMPYFYFFNVYEKCVENPPPFNLLPPC